MSLSKNTTLIAHLTAAAPPPVARDQATGLLDQARTWLGKLAAYLPHRQRERQPDDQTLPSTPTHKLIYWLKTGGTTPAANAIIARRRIRAQRLFLISASALLFSTVGAAGYPFFYGLGGLLFAVLAVPVSLQGLQDLGHGRLNINVLYLVVMGGMLLTGNFWAGNFSLLIYALAEKLTLFATDNSQRELTDQFAAHPDFVFAVIDGVEVQRPFATLQTGEIIAVHAEQMIPADGVVVCGTATVDQCVLTGEAQPIAIAAGQPVFAMTSLVSGWLHIQVEKVGDDTAVAQLGQTLNDASDFKSATQMRSQQLSDRTVLPTLLLSGLSLPIVGVNGALAVVAAHFKAQMNATAPLSALNYMKAAAQQGIFFKDGRSLDLLYGVDTVLLDLTGALTRPEPAVSQVYCFALGYDEPTILQLAAAVEAKQTHALAQAILEAAQRQDVSPRRVADGATSAEDGAKAVIDHQVVRVGTAQYMAVEQLPVTAAIAFQAEACRQQAHTLVLVAIDQQIVGGIELGAALRPEARQVVEQLRQVEQIKALYILSSEPEPPTRQLAQELGIDTCFASILPEQKAAVIEQLQAEGKSICYIGDGMQDAAALRKAHVSVSLRRVSALAPDAAQIILMEETLRRLPALFPIAQSYHKNIDLMFGVTITPMAVGIASIFLFHLGLVYVVLINKFGLAVAVGVAMLPAWRPLSQDKYLMQLDENDDEPNDTC